MSTKHEPPDPMTARVKEPGVTPYVISLIVGVPTTAMMLYLAFDGFAGAFTLALAALSALGSTLAFIGVRSRPRRFRNASLLLTLIPGAATIAAFAALVAVLVAFVTASSSN